MHPESCPGDWGKEKGELIVRRRRHTGKHVWRRRASSLSLPNVPQTDCRSRAACRFSSSLAMNCWVVR